MPAAGSNTIPSVHLLSRAGDGAERDGSSRCDQEEGDEGDLEDTDICLSLYILGRRRVVIFVHSCEPNNNGVDEICRQGKADKKGSLRERRVLLRVEKLGVEFGQNFYVSL